MLKERLDRKQRLEWVKQQGSKETSELQSSALVASTCSEPAASVQDFWKWGANGKLVRVHLKPRETKFSPVGVVDCPVDIRRLSARRVTQLGRNRTEYDFWVGTRAHQNVGYLWTGATSFFLTPEDFKK